MAATIIVLESLSPIASSAEPKSLSQYPVERENADFESDARREDAGAPEVRGRPSNDAAGRKPGLQAQRGIGIGSKPRNIVILDICSARADHFGLYGYHRPTTPGIDGLARETAVFENAMAQSSWCLPNYASLLTGHVPEVHGQYTNLPFRPLPSFEVTLAERLHKIGYRTAAFTGGIYFLPAWGLNRGFETFENHFSTSAAMPAPFANVLPRITQWLEKSKENPFFLYATIDDLHAPYQSNDSERFDPGYAGVVHDTDTIHVRFFRAYNGEDAEVLGEKLLLFRSQPRHLTHLTAHYDAALGQVDRAVVGLVNRLKEMGLWQNTVVMVTSDHGEMLGEHGLLGHTEGLYQPIVQVPLLIHHPDFPQARGRRLRQLVQRIDLTPTALDAAAADYDDGELQGRSLIPLLTDPTAPGREYGYASSKRNASRLMDTEIDERVIRDGRWKLHWYNHKDRFELYDLEKDPNEEIDLASQHPETVNRLSFQLLRLVERVRPHAPGQPSGKAEPRTPHVAPDLGEH